MADFSEVMKAGDLTDGMMKRVVLGEQDIIIARVEGKFYAAQGRCPHMRAYLSRGKLNGTVVTCPLHGSRFDLKTGKVVRWVAGKGIHVDDGQADVHAGSRGKIRKTACNLRTQN
jgi:3-phenylpropionate/trans-cinnamate dioxygenase ferredoxin subunit